MVDRDAQPLPRTRDEVRSLLWRLLARRAAEREEQRLPLGANTTLDVRLGTRGRGRGVTHTRQLGDLSLGAEGRIVLGDMIGVWPDDIRGADGILPVVLEEVYELVRIGVLRPHPDGAALFLTERGVARLAAGDPHHPLDTGGRVQAFRSEFVGAPELELLARYLTEALEAHQAGLHLAAATMIGCAYELAMLELGAAVAARWAPDPTRIPALDNDEKRAIRRIAAGEPASISQVEGAIFKALVADRGRLGDHWDWAEAGFRATFVLVRKLRNKAGHPTGARVAPDDVWTNIMLLPGWYRHVRAIVGLL